MTDKESSPIRNAFEMQRATLEQSQRTLERGIEFQQTANQMLLDGLQKQESVQRQGIEVTQTVLHTYLDALETATAGEQSNNEQLHDLVDEQFAQLEDTHAEIFESLTAEFQQGSRHITTFGWTTLRRLMNRPRRYSKFMMSSNKK